MITGAPGAGKTSLLTALAGVLEADDLPFAAVEVEALALVHPWPPDDAAFDHLAYVAGSFRRRGYPLLLVGATITGPEYLARLLDALPGGDVRLVRLEAPPALLRERIARREPADWVGLPALLERTGALSEAAGALPGVDLVLSTEGADPRALARAVQRAFGLGRNRRAR